MAAGFMKNNQLPPLTEAQQACLRAPVLQKAARPSGSTSTIAKWALPSSKMLLADDLTERYRFNSPSPLVFLTRLTQTKASPARARMMMITAPYMNISWVLQNRHGSASELICIYIRTTVESRTSWCSNMPKPRLASTTGLRTIITTLQMSKAIVVVWPIRRYLLSL